MVDSYELQRYLDALLQTDTIKDYCPNGLQVQGKSEIKTLVTGVTASQALLKKAVDLNAEAILVHHGYFWRNEDRVITGIIYQRLATLIQHHINLFTYHLPLDLHDAYGNNAQLARVLEISIKERRPLAGYDNLLTIGELKNPLSGDAFAALLTKRLGQTPLHVAGNNAPISRIGWCTGAAQNYIVEAASYGIDAYLTGEVSEQTYHLAQELGIHFFAAGHHATERYGVKALGDHLADHFQLIHHFVDIPNPV